MDGRVAEFSNGNVFRLSPREAEETFFQGYAFVGSDFVWGAAAADRHARETGTRVAPGEDGCYVTVTRAHGRYLVGVDHSGYQKVFYHWSPAGWAVSNSIPTLVEYMRAAGMAVEPRYSQLAAIAGKGAFTAQLYSLRTPVHGISLLPLGCVLSIGDDGVEIAPLPSRPVPSSYEDGLSHFIETWVRRFETLLSDRRVGVVVDVTGGRDSRTVYALCRAAERRLGLRRARFFCGRGGEDSRLADALCHSFDDRLETKLPKPPKRLCGSDAYGTWRRTCLAAYHPVYFPTGAPDIGVLRIGGNGGENHRPFYAAFQDGRIDATVYLKTRSRLIEPTWLRPEFEADIAEAMVTIADPVLDDPLILHYRHFRNRFHSGRLPQSQMGLHPLSSRYLDSLAQVAGQSRLEASQILYDILNSVEPRLMDVPFDDLKKAPSAQNMAALVHCPPGKAAAPGTVLADPCEAYLREGDPTNQSAGAGLSGGNAITHFQAELKRIAANRFVRAFFSAEFVENAI